MAEDTKIRSSEITDEATYLNRRSFIKAGALAGSAVATGALYRYLNPPPPREVSTAKIGDFSEAESPLSDELTSLQDITNYNNFYEFSTDKRGVAPLVDDFEVRPWTIAVDGLVEQPTLFGIEDLLKIDQEERIYRFRCVEGWSMVIPWVGFPLSKLIEKAKPLSKARYVAFQTYYGGANPSGAQLPPGPNGMGNIFAGIPFPYVEGLRMDEAMHPLTLLATGLYGRLMPAQNGAPIRLVVPWKYGFKSIKSVVRISFTDEEPPTTWSKQAPNEYGFYSNVNPDVPHPRWSQATERRIGEYGRRETLPFNGYGEEVAGLYKGMDLKRYY
ncbi:MAG: protein-methionine-sulfoxide reductase catalytic subunit MsrP [Acidobacteria bacterium]|nr:MAG: protein-methionine-sulfoxide reductase catalytic subunit MsrP [Acidobacteriota bacterium]REK02018.1 MAG: protein-methionine-sulfoxide reductase catalytic subunit MsrP [Acidobacteriota bacterium]REK14976.1 MAG: protein-methionine-sulfoxide reductase catalytic subunit MsrP [Acidobacteriota bacterium]REK45690.1 MAG: protein-methionine-sulfoxide reductase catalytic subunit MsrP [Acidobacteriota bacterium]